VYLTFVYIKNKIMSTTGEKINQARRNRGLTQEELSEKAKINLRTLQRIESGETEPRTNTLRLLCDVLQVNIEEVLETGMVTDLNYLRWLHLSPMAVFLMPLGSIIIPLILWLSKRDKITAVREQGINIINFQITWYAFTTIIAAFILFSQYGTAAYYLLLTMVVTNVIYPVIVSILIMRGRVRNYYPVLVRIVK
jgi:transcriptional regulator with XRE-family HTH domain